MDSTEANAKPKRPQNGWTSALLGIVGGTVGIQTSQFLGPVGWLPFICMGLVFFALWPLKLSQYRWSGLAFAGGQCAAIIAGRGIAYYLDMIELTAWLIALDTPFRFHSSYGLSCRVTGCL